MVSESVTLQQGGHKTMACLSGKGHGKKALGVLKWAPKAPKNSVYKVITVTSYESSKNIQ